MKTNYNLVICGPHGTGKSMFVELLASEAITCGKKVKWLTMEHLGDIVAKNPLTVARTKAFNQLAKRDLIIIDDIGLLDITTEQAEGFLRLITATYANTSVAITSNYHSSNFDEIMPIKHTQVLAAIDRLLHKSSLFQTQGQSQRVVEAIAQQQEDPTPQP